MTLIHEELTGKIIGAGMEVHRFLGCGFLEGVYQEALALELTSRAMEFVQEPPLALTYKGRALRHQYRPDFIVEGKVFSN